MGRWRRSGMAWLALAAGLTAYTAYIGYLGSRRAVGREGTSRDGRTPDVQFGWSYEAINYDIADDVELQARNADLVECGYEGSPPGTEVVARDGTRIAGWYIPAGNGAGPGAPTVILAHGFKSNKSGILRYGAGLHDIFNLVAFDMRNTGRSGGDRTTGGVLEQQDLRAIIDWLKRAKNPTHIGVLGNSLGAVAALGEAGDDPRVDALALDSMHTRVRHQVEARVAAAGHLSYFGSTWAILHGIRVGTGQDIESVDPEVTIRAYGHRPLLLIHGTADTEDLPARTQAFYERAVGLGIPAELHWCPGSGHNAPGGMPLDVCPDAFARWTRDFFVRSLHASQG